MSKRNKVNRSNQEAGHSNGSVSFAQTKEKAIEKGENVDRISMYFRTHKKKKDQTPTDEASRIAMEKMKELTTKVAEGAASLTLDEIFVEVMGEDRHGRVQGEGAGISKTAYYERFGRESKLQEQLEEAHKKIDEQANDIAFMKEQLKKLMTHVTGQTSEDVHGSNEDADDLNQ